jgi:hypothetical protein
MSSISKYHKSAIAVKTEKESKELQEVLVGMGYKWASGGTYIDITKNGTKPFITLENKVLHYGTRESYINSYKVISFNEFMFVNSIK